jgi:hypothetical protein
MASTLQSLALSVVEVGNGLIYRKADQIGTIEYPTFGRADLFGYDQLDSGLDSSRILQIREI